MVTKITHWQTVFSQPGMPKRMRQMHTMVEAVLILPDQAAAMTRPSSTATIRNPLTANSRSSTTARIQAARLPSATKMHSAAITRHLSARGSANLPKLDT